MFDSVFDGLFDGLAWLLGVYYTLGHNYGIAIMLFTLTVMLVLTPLTFYTTRSMLRMQTLQPQVKKIQAKYQGDRQRMNEEMMRLYQANNVNPLGSCLPILAQLPVFFVLFRLIQGLTRRVSDLGAYAGWGVLPRNRGVTSAPEFDERTFNPQYLAADSELRQALENDTEMNFLGMDLSASLTDAFRDSFSTALPFLLLIILIGVSSYIQQRQIAGRRDPDTPINPQQQMIMKVMPWFLPIISIGFPAGLNLYFVSSNIVRVGQQAVITHRIYNPHRERQALIESTLEDEEEEEPPEPVEEEPRPLARSRAPATDHGSRRPTSRTPPKRRTDSRRTATASAGPSSGPRTSPRTAKQPEAKETRAKDTRGRDTGTRGTKDSGSKSGSAKSSNQSPAQRQSSRTTQKGHQSHPTDRRRRRKKRRR
ncbi:MAG: membrane protein insertase YidC [Acidimicrobiia bacterium]|nr:membrane protein insertase YidC [Acidimicrobiia bacterium]MYG57712.1 membrane protein insertase YidC [Acidimicrobiia bacterium]MYJ32101.1 membrane protein insertase YidC [Acidimicrobiia bacterium]